MSRIKPQTGHSIFGALQRQDTSKLYLCLFVCAAGAAAVAVNLFVEGVGFSALYLGDAQSRSLMLTSLAALAFCAAGGMLTIAALIRKRRGLHTAQNAKRTADRG